MAEPYIDLMVDGNGTFYYPKTKEKAITDDDNVNLASKLTLFSTLLDCTCTYSEQENTYLLDAPNLNATLPDVFSVRFITPNNYVDNATFTFKNEVYILKYSTSEDVPKEVFLADKVVMLNCQKGTDANYIYIANNGTSIGFENGQFQEVVKAFPNTSYGTAQIRNIIISENTPDINQMNNGDIWLQI